MAKHPGAKFRLLGPEAMGGHRARQGFRFQDLWIAFHVLDWVTQDDFRGFVNEGLDDVDASWFRGRRRGGKQDAAAFDWKFYQLKDTLITPALLGEILDSFRRKEASFPAASSRYHVVASRCAERLNGLRLDLQHVRKTLITHGRESAIAAAIIAEFADKLRRTGVETDAEFVVDRVELDFTAAWVGDPELFSKQFDLRLVVHGIPPQRTVEAGRDLIALFSGEHVGALVTRDAVTAVLERYKPAVAAAAAKLVAAELPPASAKDRRPPAEGVLDQPALVSVFPGEAVLLRLPGGSHGLVDCGMAAASQIIPYLAERKVDTLDFVAVSHWHSDRYNGVLSVIGAMKRVRKLLLPGFPRDPDPEVRERFLGSLESRGPRRLGIGEVATTNARNVVWPLDGAGGSARVEAFAADMHDPGTRRASVLGGGFGAPNINDYCTVFRLSVGRRSFLISTDATIKRWTDLFKQLLGRGESLRCDGLTLPRHGSRHSLDKDILAAIADPSGFYAVVSPDPRFRLPHREALDLVRAGNGEILVCDTAPVHLLLTRDGLFERRFALSPPGDGGRVRS